MAHIQPENLQNAPKMHFWQKALGQWVKERWKFILAEMKANMYSKQVPHCNFYFICGGFIKGHALAVRKVLLTWFDNLGCK